MTKNFGKCGLCKSKKLLNFAGLCKRCNQSKASSKIADDAMKKQQEEFAAQKEREALEAKRLKDLGQKETPDTDAVEEGEETEGEAKDEGTKGDDKKDK